MIYLVEWALTAIGVTYVVTQSVIFAPIRIRIARLHTILELFIYCPMCVGFWVGALLWWMWPSVSPWWWVRVVLSATASMGLMRVLPTLSDGGAVWLAEKGLRDGEATAATGESEGGSDGER